MRQYLGSRVTAFAVATMFIMLIITSGMTRIVFSASLKHFTGLKPTPMFIDFMGKCIINTKEAQPGDEVAVFTKDKVLCGAASITTPGQYGILHVYGDDPGTPEIEGAAPGDELTFVVWNSQADLEYTLSLDEMTPGTLGSFASSSVPPVWIADKSRYGLNISAQDKRQFRQKTIKVMRERE